MFAVDFFLFFFLESWGMSWEIEPEVQSLPLQSFAEMASIGSRGCFVAIFLVSNVLHAAGPGLGDLQCS